MSGEADEHNPTRRAITSKGLTNTAVIACWSVSVLLLGSGIAATFVVGTGAAPAAMILFGSLFLVLALMRRVPLSLDVGGAKFDASYEIDAAYDAGRDFGRQLGVEDALTEAEKAKQRGEPVDEALQAQLDRLVGSESTRAPERAGAAAGSVTLTGTAKGQAPTLVGFRGPAACKASGITYRQLDYWTRTGLVEPSLRSAGGDQRLFAPHDILLLRVTKRLLDAGIALQTIRIVIHRLRERGPKGLEQVVLLTNGDSVWLAKNDQEVVDLLRSGDGMSGIAVGSAQRGISQVLSELPSEPARPG